MQHVVSAEEMRRCDEAAIRSFGIPSLFLMESAGAGVAGVVQSRYGSVSGKRVLIVCGRGNNGGDGFVVARHLSNKGARVDLLLLAAPRSLTGDAKRNYEILKAISRRCPGFITLHPFSSRVFQKISPPALIVDAIFGTGFSGKVKSPVSKVIEWINRQQVPVISIDIPSGVQGTTGTVEGPAIKATVTPTMGALKTGLLCNQGRDLSGEVVVVDIGIPPAVFNDPRLKTQLVDREDVRAMLPTRSPRAHKYSVGKVFVLAGSRDFTGAAALCANACLKSGAGAVVLGVPESVFPIVAKKVAEPIVVPLAATKDGTLGRGAVTKIHERLAWADVVVIGPGLSQNEETAYVVLQVLRSGFERIVLDADGLNIVATRGLGFFRRSQSRFILTPHAGELSRITKIPSSMIEQNRIEIARSTAKKTGATVVLKGAPSVTAGRDGLVYINSTGNPGMATVGSGDVLAGLIGGLWAQGAEEVSAAVAGVYVHGLAGDLASAKLGERSIVAGDLVALTPHAFSQVGGKC